MNIIRFASLFGTVGVAVAAPPTDPEANDGRGLKAPTILMARALESPGGARDVATNVLRIKGGALITGWTSSGNSQPDGLLLRVDDEGKVLERKTFGGDAMDALWNIQPDGAGGGGGGSGGWIAVGFMGSKGAGELDGWAMRLDEKLAVTWERTFGGAAEDWLVSFARSKDSWMGVGQTRSRGAGGIDAQVVRMSATGAELSTWTWGHPALDRAFAILPMDDGGCIIGGMTGPSREDCDAFVTRLDSRGKEVWAYKPERNGFGVTHDLKRAADGSIIAFGYEVQLGRNNDGFIKKLSPDGKLLSDSHFGGPTYDRVTHGEVFADGTCVAAGYTQRPGSRTEEEGWDMVVRVIDPAGAVRWEQRFGGEGAEFGRGISGTIDDVWIVGHTESGRDRSAVYLVRIDARAQR